MTGGAAGKLVRTGKTALRTLRRRGVGGSVGLAVEEVVGVVRYGRGSGGHVRQRDLHADRQHHEFAAVRFRTARRALSAVPPHERGGIVDLGCGRARALVVAHHLGYGPLVGVELAPSLVAQALDVVARRLPAGTATIVEGDAAVYRLPPELSVVFVANPFGPDVMAHVVAEIDRSQREHPRTVWVVYVMPHDRGLFEAVGFETVWDDIDSAVLRRPPS